MWNIYCKQGSGTKRLMLIPEQHLTEKEGVGGSRKASRPSGEQGRKQEHVRH